MTEKPYYEIREEEQGMEFVDVFMIQHDGTGGVRKDAGYVYTVRKFEADSLAQKGAATLVDVAPLKLTKGKMDGLTKQLQEASEKIKNNDLLSDIGKRHELQTLVSQYEDAAETLQNQYANELDILKQAEFKKTQEFKSSSKIDPQEARTQAGLVKAAASVAPTLKQSIEVITSKIPTLDIAVARELLSQFSDIKRDIEAKKTGSSVQEMAANSRLIRELYTALETASTTPDQANASTKYKMLEAIALQRGDIRTDFKNKARALRRMY